MTSISRRGAICSLSGGAIVVLLVAACTYNGVVRSHDPPCYRSNIGSCAVAERGLRTIAEASCEGTGRRVCLAPLGTISEKLVRDLVSYYEAEYGLNVGVLTPQAVPTSLAGNDDEQIDAEDLIGYMEGRFPDEASDPDVTLIGLTPLDIYDKSSDFYFIFGSKGSPAESRAVISTFRMDPRTFGGFGDDKLLFERAQKMVTRYIGVLYYGLPTVTDPASPMTDRIMGLSDLDNITDRLPVQTPAS